MGAICRLVNETESSEQLVINVEYNQLDSLLKAKWNPQGDIPNEKGYSSFPGNTNTLVFKIPEYVTNLTKTGGVIPEFVNPKYANEERTVFKAPTRLECMMQDYPKLLQQAANKVGFTMYETWFCFSPAKNNVTDAKNCHAKGLPSFGAAQAEFDFYNWTNKMLKLVGVNVKEQTQATDCAGIPFNFGPKILIEPQVALTLQDLRDKFKSNVNFSANSTIVLTGKAGEESQYTNLTVDGTVRADRPINFFDHFSERFCVFEPATDADEEVYRIRGYKPAEKSEE